MGDISLGGIHNLPARSKFAPFQGFLNFCPMHQNFVLYGGGMCILFICEKRAFQKCMGWGGEVVTFFSTRAAKPACKHALSISHSLVPNMLFDAPSFGCTSGDLHVSHYAPNQRRCRLTKIHAEKPWWGESSYPQNCTAKAAASEADRTWCSAWSHAGCCEPPARGFFAGLADMRWETCTHSAPPEHALLRTKGFCGASGEAIARCVNLYADMVAAC